MTNHFDQTRARLAEVGSEIRDLQERRTVLLSELTEIDRRIGDAEARAEPLSAKVAQFALEPERREQLGRLIRNLTAQLEKAPSTSPTIRAIRQRLPTLSDEATSAAARLGLARQLLETLGRYTILDRQLWDAATPRIAGRE